MRRKLNAARCLNNTNNDTKREALKSKIESLEDQLRTLSHKKRKHTENEATKDLRHNPQDFFNLVKKISKTSDKVGPFKRNNKNKNHSAAEIISQQYKNVFSKPVQKNHIENHRKFLQ